MSWLGHVLGRRDLPPAIALRLAAWRSLPQPDTGVPPRRWVVLDTETSGLDTARDALISIGAVAMEDDSIVVAPAFEAILRQANPSSHENIALHGVGAGAQSQGEDPVEALIRFLEFARKDPLVAWHASFDAAFLRRALKRHLGPGLANEWLDVALLAPRKLSGQKIGSPGPGVAGLDDWLARFGIDPGARHNALADAYATAQLFQIAAQRVARDGQRRLCDFLELAGEQVAIRQRQGTW